MMPAATVAGEHLCTAAGAAERACWADLQKSCKGNKQHLSHVPPERRHRDSGHNSGSVSRPAPPRDAAHPETAAAARGALGICRGYRGGSRAGAGAALPWPMTLAPTVVPRLCVPSDSPLQRACPLVAPSS